MGPLHWHSEVELSDSQQERAYPLEPEARRFPTLQNVRPTPSVRPKAVLRHNRRGPWPIWTSSSPACRISRDILCGLLKSGKVKIAVGCPHCLHVGHWLPSS